jgi:hypothetical protein
MGHAADDVRAPAPDHRSTMLTPTVTELKRGSAHKK